jgi:ATP adenylyltransferase
VSAGNRRRFVLRYACCSNLIETQKAGGSEFVLTTPERKMDYLWTPWRYQYIKSAIAGEQPECIFCDAAKCTDDARTLVVHRGVSSFVILNRFPYTVGHLMIVPYKHAAELAGLDPATLAEMMQLAQRTETAFKSLYKPEGINLGMNLGRAAGAGVLGHLHLHTLPRWTGDANFMTVTGETRVLAEELSTTYERVRDALA